ncbi:MAG: site-specific integrase [Pyrinomonadaceae bacterium]
MTKVFLREKKLVGGQLSLYLDFYPPIKHPETKKETRRQFLKLYLYARPGTELQRDHNKETRMLAETIRAKRQLEVQVGDYGFLMNSSRKDFIDFFEKVVESKKRKSRSTHNFWRAALHHLKEFTEDACRFGDVTERFCNEFRDYLLDADLAQNTASGYFKKFRSVCQSAARQKLFRENPMENVENIPETEVQREFLTLEELKKLHAAPFRFETLKRAALFSALTGLRRSDILKLTWSEVHFSRDRGHFIRFRQQKTQSNETLPISPEAFELLGKRAGRDEKVFRGISKYHIEHFQDWADLAGIDKTITFHIFRHTFAVLQLAAGTGIYTVSKMLGHKDLRTTEIYAKIVDEKKREAANRIKLK